MLDHLARPRKLRTRTVARIICTGGAVRVRFPEKHKRFNAVMKDFSCLWKLPYWIRNTNDPTNLAAEIGLHIVANGFFVAFPDQETLELAVNREYDPEIKRKIRIHHGGQFDNWFEIWWQYSEDCYDRAKQITASKYCKPCVVVPPEHYEEVLDFAEMHGFVIDEEAQELAQAAEKALQSALVVEVTPEELEPEEWSRENLGIPETTGIEDELLDEPL